jgi:hypothetical protein
MVASAPVAGRPLQRRKFPMESMQMKFAETVKKPYFVCLENALGWH